MFLRHRLKLDMKWKYLVWIATEKQRKKHIIQTNISVTLSYFMSANSDRIGQVGTGTCQTTAAAAMAWHSLTTPLALTVVYSASINHGTLT